MDPASRIGQLRDRDEVEDTCEVLCRENGYRHERVAPSEYGEYQTLRSVDVLVDYGESCSACLGCLDGRLGLVQLRFEAEEYV